MAEIQAPNGYEVNEAIDGANDIMEIFQPGSGGLRRNKKVLLNVLKAFFQALAAGAAGRIVTLTAGGIIQDSAVNISDVNDNTTHRSSNGNDHSNVGLNNTHRGSDGTDHTFIDQDVRTTADVVHNSTRSGTISMDDTVKIQETSPTENTLFDLLIPFLPSDGDKRILSGGFHFISGLAEVRIGHISRMSRTSSSIIVLESTAALKLEFTAGALTGASNVSQSFTLNDGDATALTGYVFSFSVGMLVEP